MLVIVIGASGRVVVSLFFLKGWMAVLTSKGDLQLGGLPVHRQSNIQVVTKLGIEQFGQ